MTLPGHQLLDQIHRGRRRAVWRAIREHDHRRVIVKTVVHPEATEIAALAREHELFSTLSTPGLARSLGVATWADGAALILEDPGGLTLGELASGGPMPVDRFLRVGLALTGILGALHDHGVIHKDVNPRAILIDPETGGVTLIDLHNAIRLVSEPQEPRPPGVLQGTLAYMSPEQTGRMSRQLDARGDLYSLGATFYEGLTGHPPFDAVDALELIHSHLARLPIPPATLVPGLPRPVSDIVMRLLAKTPEQRYQSAKGLLADLAACLAEWELTGAVTGVVAGEADVHRRFEIPKQLYGREPEIAGLLAAFDRACAGAVEIVMVSGYAGIGKTSLIRELYAPSVRQRGYLTSGKFDQIVRLPYGALIQAFRGLLQQLLSEDEAELARWKRHLEFSLGAGAEVLAEVMPEIELLLGKRESPPALNPSEAKNRFRLALQNLVATLARAQHPLVIFLDDLQWADTATLDLIEPFLTGLESGHLLLVCAYRDNDVDVSHPLGRALADLEGAGLRLQRLKLGPLGHGDLVQLLGDTLRCDSAAAGQLARIVFEKTAGNPFFVIQFLEALYREGLVAYNPAGRSWTYDPDAIAAAGMTDNVIDLMARRIGRLSPTARAALTFGACIGNRFDLPTLAIASEQPVEAAAEHLREALDEGLLLAVPGQPDPPAYAFLHDRVQQAAYATIPHERRHAVHLTLGRLLQEGWDPATAEERLFDIVHHLNLGRESIVDPEEALRLARLDLTAAQRARSSTAFEAAREYVDAAIGLLPPERWETDYELLFELHLLAAECEFVAGDELVADRLVSTLLSRARTRLDRARVYRLQIVRYEYLTRYADAIRIGRDALRLFGIEFPEDPEGKRLALERETAAIAAATDASGIDALADRPVLTDPEVKSLMQLLASLHTPCYLVGDKTLTLLNTAAMVSLSLEHGNTQESALAYVLHAMHIGPILGRYADAYEFGRLALRLNDILPDPGIRARVLMNFSWAVSVWRRPLQESFPYIREAFRLGNETGLFSDAGYAQFNECYFELLSGPDLRRVARACEANVEYLRRIKMQRFVDGPMVIRQWALALQGRTASPTSLDDVTFSEADFDAAHRDESLFRMFRDAAKLSLLCIFGQWERARVIAEQAAEPLREYTGTIWDALRVYHEALALAGVYQDLPGDRRRDTDAVLDALQRRLEGWAENAPENFRAQHLLVSAEIARARGQDDEAMAGYDRALDAAAKETGPRNRAMAAELCGRFWQGRGQRRVAGVFLNDARSAYRQWGATAKAEALESEFPELRDLVMPFGIAEAAQPGTPAIDSDSVIKAADAIAGEIDLGRLVGTLLRLAIQNAGAERGVLLVERDGEAWVQGEGTSETIDVYLENLSRLEQYDRLPQRICNFVRHTTETVLLDDARADDRHGADPYVLHWQPRSVMCSPVLHQGRLVAMLYLENNLTTGAFTPDRVRVIQILASQAAVSLMNAQLYEAMRQEIDERIRAESKLRAIAQGTASVAAGDFFTSLVRHLAGALGLRYAFLSECVDERRIRVRTLAFWNGVLGENFAFDLAGTPCRQVIDGELASFPENLQSLFPADLGLVEWGAESYLGIPLHNSSGDVLGHLAVLDDKPFYPKEADIEILKIFGARAGTELERMHAEDALRSSELRYSTLAEAVPEILFTTRADGFCDYTSGRFQEYSGLSAEETLGDGWVAVVHPDDRGRTMEAWLAAVKSGRPYQIEYRLRRADGEYRWFRGQAIPMRDGVGEIVQWFGACADIHDLKRADQDLRKALAEVRNLKDRLEVENVYLQEQISLEHGFEEIVGRSPPLVKVLQQVEQVAPADTTVLITGETGTGKELVARAIHRLSPRRDRAMITVNCGAISPGLVESELFGHEKGSFTGALAQKIGRFELADGGAIFLDEIGDLPPDLQVKLLRMLQEGEIERVGGERPIRVNVRVIAATHKNLEEAIEEGHFRADLYYRLNVFPIHTPALRERKEDIPALVRYFVQKYSNKLRKPIHSIPKSTLDALTTYTWPGNVRELANILERSVIVSRGTTLELGEWLTSADSEARESGEFGRTLHELTRQRILEALEETGWRVSGPRGAARLLGLKPTTLEARMRRLDIRRPKTAGSD